MKSCQTSRPSSSHRSWNAAGSYVLVPGMRNRFLRADAQRLAVGSRRPLELELCGLWQLARERTRAQAQGKAPLFAAQRGTHCGLLDEQPPPALDDDLPPRADRRWTGGEAGTPS